MKPLSRPSAAQPKGIRYTDAHNADDSGVNLLLSQAALRHTNPKRAAHDNGAFDQEVHTAIDYVRY